MTHKDNRYTVTRECDGHPLPRYVVRFCGEFIGSHADKATADAMRDSSAAARRFAPHSAFFIGYIECLYFVDTGDADGGQPPSDAELSDDARAACLRDCERFERDNAALLSLAYTRDYDAAQAGRDFYFTRNGHGVGYWDRAELKADGLGERLSDAARNAGGAAATLGDDGLIHMEAA